MNPAENKPLVSCGSSTEHAPASSLDIQQYRDDLEPTSILDLIDRSVLEEMVRALNYKFRKGAVLLYATKVVDKGVSSWQVLKGNKINSADADPNFGNPIDMEFFNPFCEQLAKTIGRGKCEKSDCALGQMFVDDSNKKPELLPCWLRLHEACAPIQIAGQTRALLIAGGQIVENEEHEKRIAARLHELNAGCKLHEDGKTRITDEQMQELEGKLKEKCLNKQIQESPASTLRRVSEFAVALQKIVNSIFSVRRIRANHKLMVRLAQGLVRGDWGNSQNWWQNAGALFQEMRQILDVAEIVIYTRFGSHFERTWASNPKTTATNRLATRQVVTSSDTDSFTLMEESNPQHRELLKDLNMPKASTVHLLHTDRETSKAHYGTLLLLVGELSDQKNDLAETFCQEVALRLSIVALVFNIQDMAATFRERVFEISHSFRTPLQALICDIDKALSIPMIKEDGTMRGRLEQSLDLLYDAKTDVNLLLKEAKPVEGSFDLGSLLTQITLDLEALLEGKNCEFEERGTWPTDIILNGDRSRLRLVFINLIENAFKYSWRNRSIVLDFDLTKAGDARVGIENYGLGVPPDKQRAIFALGVRLGYADPDADMRQGAGMGLSHAMKIIKEFGGDITLTSHPSSSRPQDPDRPYHNWITKVVVTLPVK